MIPVPLSNSDLYQILLQKATPSFSNFSHRSSVNWEVLIQDQIGLSWLEHFNIKNEALKAPCPGRRLNVWSKIPSNPLYHVPIWNKPFEYQNSKRNFKNLYFQYPNQDRFRFLFNLKIAIEISNKRPSNIKCKIWTNMIQQSHHFGFTHQAVDRKDWEFWHELNKFCGCSHFSYLREITTRNLRPADK